MVGAICRILKMAVSVLQSISKVNKPFVFQGIAHSILCLLHSYIVTVLVRIVCSEIKDLGYSISDPRKLTRLGSLSFAFNTVWNNKKSAIYRVTVCVKWKHHTSDFFIT